MDQTRFEIKSGGADRDRTDDLVIANDALFRLSYGPSCKSCDDSACFSGASGVFNAK